MYEEIKNDKYIIELYNSIEKTEDKENGYAYHNFQHAINVTRTIENILKSLDYSDNFIEKAKIAGILHDIGTLEGKENHAYRGYIKSKKYFKENNIYFEGIDDVLDAIKIHSDGFDTNNIIALVLILADKLDIEKTRLGKAGYSIEGLNEIRYIEKIDSMIENNTLKIQFYADERINLEKLEQYYFTKKVFKAIKVFSDKLNLKYFVTVNNKEWIIK